MRKKKKKMNEKNEGKKRAKKNEGQTENEGDFFFNEIVSFSLFTFHYGFEKIYRLIPLPTPLQLVLCKIIPYRTDHSSHAWLLKRFWSISAIDWLIWFNLIDSSALPPSLEKTPHIKRFNGSQFEPWLSNRPTKRDRWGGFWGYGSRRRRFEIWY